MRCRALIAAFALATGLHDNPAAACGGYGKFEPWHAASADVVVIGRIENYQYVPARIAAQADAPQAPSGAVLPGIGRVTNGRNWPYPFARFEVVVEEVLLGEVPPRLTATLAWDPAQPLRPGPFLLAMQAPGSQDETLEAEHARRRARVHHRFPGLFITLDPEPGTFRLLSSQCMFPFLMAPTGDHVDAIRQVLIDSRPDRIFTRRDQQVIAVAGAVIIGVCATALIGRARRLRSALDTSA